MMMENPDPPVIPSTLLDQTSTSSTGAIHFPSLSLWPVVLRARSTIAFRSYAFSPPHTLSCITWLDPHSTLPRLLLSSPTSSFITLAPGPQHIAFPFPPILFLHLNSTVSSLLITSSTAFPLWIDLSLQTRSPTIPFFSPVPPLPLSLEIHPLCSPLKSSLSTSIGRGDQTSDSEYSPFLLRSSSEIPLCFLFV